MSARQTPPRIAIIGGGITGLAAAHRLHELAATNKQPLEITIFEASERVGGALETIHHDGLTVETGADSFLSEKPWALELTERLGLSNQLVRTQEQFRKTLVVRDGRLVPIPEGFSLMAPTYLMPVLRSPLFSPSGKARMMLEPLVPRRRDITDESLASFVSRRLGREVLERVAQPLAAGIYTADPAMLSAQSTMPRFVEMEHRYGSLIRGLRMAARTRDANSRATSGARWSLFVSCVGGVGTLIDALSARLPDVIRYNSRIEAIARDPESGWRLTLANGDRYSASIVICAAPAFVAARLLKSYAHRLAAGLAKISYASAATVNLAWRVMDFPHLPNSFGFVVPIIERRKIIAGSFSSLKFPGRAPANLVLARVFIGGALQTAMMDLDDNAMVAAAREEFRALLGVTAPPLFTRVRRWPTSMPQYAVGHRDLIAAIRTEAANLPDLLLAGAYLDGVGIPDCIHSGEAAAEAAFGQLPGISTPAHTSATVD
jgi:oxygen-dependent protoporphyrinogen oxidase